MNTVNDGPHILVVDDDREIRSLLARFLDRHGFRVTTAADGREMRAARQGGQVNLVVLDLVLPGEDGFSLCRAIRTDSDLPIVVITAHDAEDDRIDSLDMGADDYLAKPFNPRELVARIRAVLRRTGEQAKTAPSARRLCFRGWELDPAERTLARPDGSAVALTGGEFDLLLALVERAGQVLDRDRLLEITGGQDAKSFDRSIDTRISRLRDRLGDDGKAPALIKTVRGRGYVLAAAVEELG